MAAGRGRAATVATLWPHNEGLDVFEFGGSGGGIALWRSRRSHGSPDRWDVTPGLPLGLPTEADAQSLLPFL